MSAMQAAAREYARQVLADVLRIGAERKYTGDELREYVRGAVEMNAPQREEAVA